MGWGGGPLNREGAYYKLRPPKVGGLLERELIREGAYRELLRYLALFSHEFDAMIAQCLKWT